MPNTEGTKSAGESNEKGLKVGVVPPEDVVAPPQAEPQGPAPVSLEPTSGIVVMVTRDKYLKLPSPVPKGKSYKQTPVIIETTPEPAILQGKGPTPASEPTPEPAATGPKGKGPKAAPSGPAPVVPQTNPAAELEAAPPQENGGGASIPKGHGAKPTKSDCVPSGVPNGQWMKIPRSGHNAGAGATGTNTKGYGAGAGVPNGYGAQPNRHAAGEGGYSNGGGAKANKPGHGAGGYPLPGRGDGNAGLGYPYAGKPKQPSFGQGAYLGAGYRNSYGGNGNGYGAGVQPDYASLGHGANKNSGGARRMPYNGAPLDGMSPFEPQSAGLGPHGKLGSMFGMGAEKSNNKYGIGGLQFGGQPPNTEGKYGYGGSPYGPAGDGKSPRKYGGVDVGMGGDPAPAQYGYGGFPNAGQLLRLASNGNAAGKYGYGRMPYETQQGLRPEAISTGSYGMAGSPYQHEPLGRHGKLTGKYGGGEVPYAPQAFGFRTEANPFEQYANQGPYPSQPLGSAPESRSGGQYDAAGSPYDPLPVEPDSAVISYMNGDAQTPAAAVEGDGTSIDAYGNVGYINGQVQPEVVAFPAAPTASPTLAYPSVAEALPVEAITPDAVPEAGVEDRPEAGVEDRSEPALDFGPPAESQGVAQAPEQPDEPLHQQQQQQPPRQIHIQQHLKLHFQPQGEKKNGKYDLNGFFGNSGYQEKSPIQREADGRPAIAALLLHAG
ncbi:calymmin [Pseudoliparis swirei]|uniref:calymmin n=1 Tax=Pseudoliparis swirei TaxID=2059687 RepID=UPI0024BD68A0|nr:calymmin [Pseudoliparis swirei]